MNLIPMLFSHLFAITDNVPLLVVVETSQQLRAIRRQVHLHQDLVEPPLEFGLVRHRPPRRSGGHRSRPSQGSDGLDFSVRSRRQPIMRSGRTRPGSLVSHQDGDGNVFRGESETSKVTFYFKQSCS